MGDETLRVVLKVVQKNIKLFCDFFRTFDGRFHHPLGSLPANSSDKSFQAIGLQLNFWLAQRDLALGF